MKKIDNIYKRLDERGTFVEYINSEISWKSVNGGHMKKGAVMGNHYHKVCISLFFFVSGGAEVLIKDVRKENTAPTKLNLTANEGVVFEPYETHVLHFTDDSIYILLKSEIYKEDSNDMFDAPLI